MSYKSTIKKTGKLLLYILLSVLLLVCLLFIYLNTSSGKRMLKNQVQTYLQKKLKTRVVIGSVNYHIPSSIEINGVYLEDQKKDTLLYGEKIAADIKMFQLIWGNTSVQQLELRNIFMHVNRAEKDSSFNYQFIIDAFASKTTTTTIKDTTPLKINLDKLILHNISLRFSDKNGGTDFSAGIEEFNATLSKFQPDRVDFGIKDLFASGVKFFMKTYKEKVKQPYLPVAEDKISEPGYGLHITAGNFNIKDAKVEIENSLSGMYYANNVSDLLLQNALFNLSSSLATADELQILDAAFRFVNPRAAVSTTPKELPGDVEPMPWQIAAKHVALKNNSIRFDDNNIPQAGGFDPGHFNIRNLTTDINGLAYSTKRTAAQVTQLTFKDSSGFTLDTTHMNFLMTDSILSARELYVKTPQTLLQNFIELKFDSLAGITRYPRNTLIAATLKNSTLAFDDLYLLAPALKNAFPPEQFAGNKVFFNTEIKGNLAQVYLPYLQLAGFSGTNLRAHGTLYNLTDADKFYYDLYIDQSSFWKKDILKFIPKENQQSLANLPNIISLRGHVTGNKNELLSDIIASGQGMAFNGKFSVKNLADSRNLKYDLALRESSFDKDFILGIIPPGTLPPGINLPDKNYIRGMLKGDLDNLLADLQLGGSYGLITVKGFIKNARDKERANYDLLITTSNYDIGKLISQDSMLGKVTGTFKLKGTGFDYKTMRSDITASVKQLQYNKYNYQNANITARLNSGLIDSKGTIDDENLKLQYDIRANVKNEYPAVNGLIRVDTARLQALNLYTDTLNFSLTANIQANSLTPRNLDVNTVIDSVQLQSGSAFYKLDSISLIATSANGRDSINFYAPFAAVQAAGAFDYDKVGTAVAQYINHYYKISDSVSSKNIPDQQLVFAGSVKKHPLVIAVVPGLKDYSDIGFNGSFASADADSALNFRATIPFVAYDSYKVRNGSIEVASRNERINYDVQFDTLNLASNTLYGSRLNGSAAHDSVMINAITQDNKATDWFGLKASLYVKDKSYSFRLQDSLLLNYERWNVPSDNYISYSPQGFIIHDFVITSDTASISITSREEVPNSPVDVEIENFNLKSISSILNQDTVFVAGILDAKAALSDLDKKLPSFTGDFTVTNLSLMEQPLGTLIVSAKKQNDDNVNAFLTLSGYGNIITAKGNYYLNNEQEQFDASANITRLSMASLQGFTKGQLKNSTGNIYGNFTLNGKFADPRWKGELNFDTTRFTVSQLGTAFKIDKQKISFNYPAVALSNFTIKDSLDHPLKIDGAITANQSKGYDVNLDINTKDFILLNAPKAINSEFYGFAAIDADIKVTGNSVSPDIEGNIAVKDKSDVTIIIPERSYNKDQGKTIVRFIDRDTFDINPPVIPFVEEKEATSNFAQFLNYNLNVEVKKAAALTIVIDPVTGDEIRVQGDATLNAGVDPGGHLILSGNYELDKGYYIFNYQFLQRRFALEKGSSITFAGAPMEAQMSITAVYTVNTSSRDLLDNEVGSVDPLLANSFNQKIPFRVLLYLTGTMSRPTIKFDIQLPDESAAINGDLRTTIENKLAQIRGDESAINKQVFSLLLLNRFVGERSSDFFKGNGDDFSDLARQSVSGFLSSALNEIAGNILKGVDIDLNLNTYRDYSNGGNAQRTDLNVALSKNFLDDRLTVTIGKNFGVQGPDASGSSGNFIPDVTIGYKLTKDGKYLLKAYRKNQFEVVLDGYVVETGLGFVVTMDYNKFNELFRRNRKK